MKQSCQYDAQLEKEKAFPLRAYQTTSSRSTQRSGSKETDRRRKAEDETKRGETPYTQPAMTSKESMDHGPSVR